LPKPHSHYKDFLDLRGDGRIVLYKRADHRNPKWTVRLKIPDTDGFVVKSTKTTDDFEARRLAEDLYYRLEGKARRGEPINSPTFRRVFIEWARVLAPAYLRDDETRRRRERLPARGQHGNVGRDAGGVLRQEAHERPEDGDRGDEEQEPRTGRRTVTPASSN
jgi:hypothetical protein